MPTRVPGPRCGEASFCSIDLESAGCCLDGDVTTLLMKRSAVLDARHLTGLASSPPPPPPNAACTVPTVQPSLALRSLLRASSERFECVWVLRAGADWGEGMMKHPRMLTPPMGGRGRHPPPRVPLGIILAPSLLPLFPSFRQSLRSLLAASRRLPLCCSCRCRELLPVQEALVLGCTQKTVFLVVHLYHDHMFLTGEAPLLRQELSFLGVP